MGSFRVVGTIKRKPVCLE